MTNLELSKNIRHELFADRGTDLQAAVRYAYDSIKSLEGKDAIAAFTALHVVLNTVANIVQKNEMEQA